MSYIGAKNGSGNLSHKVHNIGMPLSFNVISPRSDIAVKGEVR